MINCQGKNVGLWDIKDANCNMKVGEGKWIQSNQVLWAFSGFYFKCNEKSPNREPERETPPTWNHWNSEMITL